MTEIQAAVAGELLDVGYRKASFPSSWDDSCEQLFEDSYGIVHVVVYETWTDLADRWTEAQGRFVELLSEHLRRPEPKSWEGYLVLLTPGTPLSESANDVTRIRYDVSRVRKLVATGDDLGSIAAVKRVILPLLPLELAAPKTVQGGIVSKLPALLVEHGVPFEDAQMAIDAYLANESVLEVLHRADPSS